MPGGRDRPHSGRRWPRQLCLMTIVNRNTSESWGYGKTSVGTRAKISLRQQYEKKGISLVEFDSQHVNHLLLRHHCVNLSINISLCSRPTERDRESTFYLFIMNFTLTKAHSVQYLFLQNAPYEIRSSTRSTIFLASCKACWAIWAE